jgi:hypothetical protein
MNRKNDETVAHQAADVVDNVADGLRSAAHSVGGGVQNAAHAVRDAAGRAAHSVAESYEHAGEFTRKSVKQTRARLRSWEDSFESRVRDHPKTCLLLAAVIGAAVASIWRRR